MNLWHNVPTKKREDSTLLKVFLITLFTLMLSMFFSPIRTVLASQTIKIDANQLIMGPEGETTKEAFVYVVIQSDYPIKDVYYIDEKIEDKEYIIRNGEEPEYVSNSILLTVHDSGTYTIYVTDYFGNDAIANFEVKNVDGKAPTFQYKKNESLSKLMSSYVYNISVKDDYSEVVSFQFQTGYVEGSDDESWSSAPSIIDNQTFSVQTAGLYSFRTEDSIGNVDVITCYLGGDEFRAVWVSYLEYETKGYTYESFKKRIDEMFTKVTDMNMNAVIVHVRPFGDAMYQSLYYPWSRYASGTQGKDPGFDPLSYMIEAAHKRGLEIHAWINPYRITNNTTDYKTLSKDNPARVWLEDSNKSNDRNVLSYGGKLYYNPSKPEVQELIINGIKELVSFYNIDGIHFDDYFYPSLGTNYSTNFDAQEYKEYVAKQQSLNKSYLSIADWRRNNVSELVKAAYSAIKEIDPNCEFGISPGGFYKLLTSNTQYYVDYKKWMSQEGYIDYICPQIYWSNEHSTYPYNDTLDAWLSSLKCNVKVYVGIAAYKAGTKSEEAAWYQNANVLAEQISYARNSNLVSGFVFFRYDTFVEKANYVTLKNMLKELNAK